MVEAAILTEKDKYLPFLLEIRRRFLFLLSLFLIAAIAGFFYYQEIIGTIVSVFHFPGVNLVFTSPFQFLGLALNTSLLLGLAIIFPFLTYQILAFLKPALHPKEFRALLAVLPIGIILFLIGFTYGIFVMRFSVELFFVQSQKIGVGNFLDIGNLLSQTLTIATLLGLAFQFPILLALLLHFQLISRKALAKKRFIVYFVGLIFIVLLPINDILVDAILLLPLVILFEVTLLLNKIMFKGK